MPLVCQPPQSICESQCVDTDTHPLHCGDCNLPCAGGTECRGGACLCPASLTECNGVCVDLDTDSGNCMRCGNTCLGSRVCNLGACVCPPNTVECDGSCVDLETSEEHCGMCNRACSPLQTCEARECTCGDLDACPGESTGYCSQNLERLCCGPDQLFCDVQDTIGFTGGCVQNTLDCGSIFPCGDTFAACSADRAGYCSTTGAPACCAVDRPLFCDANPGLGYDGGCWDADVNCNSLSACGTVLFACRNDLIPYCSSTEAYTCCPPNEIFCNARAGIGYDGGCWPSTINCGSITNCNGNFVACPAGSGNPNCTTNVCE